MEVFTLKSSLIPNTEPMSTVIGKGARDCVTEEGLKFGVIWDIVLFPHEPIAAPEWFTIVSCAFPNVNLRLAYMSGATFARLRNALSVCRCPNSISTGADITETAGFFGSEGCRLAPMMEASKNRTATPLGGVSPMLKLRGKPPLVFMEFMELPQAAKTTLLRSARAKGMIRLMEKPPAIAMILNGTHRRREGGRLSFPLDAKPPELVATRFQTGVPLPDAELFGWAIATRTGRKTNSSRFFSRQFWTLCPKTRGARVSPSNISPIWLFRLQSRGTPQTHMPYAARTTRRKTGSEVPE